MSKKTLTYNIGNDNGNSEQAMYINNELFKQDNVYFKTTRLPWSDDSDPSTMIDDLLNHLAVTIDSAEVNPGLYFIGALALRSTDIVRTMDVLKSKKHKESVPLINTLGLIAGKAVQDFYKENNELATEIKVRVNMATALPAKQWTRENAREFKNRFMNGEHRVTVHLKQTRVSVTITFDHVEVLAEGVPAAFALQRTLDGQWRKGDIFDSFASNYELGEIDGSYFKELRLLHDDIGDGSTEFVITVGPKFLEEHVDGINSGVGHAIEQAMDDFQDSTGLEMLSRQDFSGYLRNQSKYSARAIEALQVPLETQVELNISRVNRQFRITKNEIDVVVVYGGGSIVMREVINVLEEPLRDLVESKEAKLLYVDAKYATILNAEGLAIFVQSPVFKKLKSLATAN